MKWLIGAILVLSLIFVLGCTRQDIAGNDSDIHGCIGSAGYQWCESKQKCLRVWEESCSNTADSMTIEEARVIAQNSECIANGTLKDTYFYNNNSKTWWIDLNIEKQGCAPACVVMEESRTAEINWRCTGAIPPEYTCPTESTINCMPIVPESMKQYCSGAYHQWISSNCDTQFTY